MSMNILIPMAGHGSRYSQQGFTDPKPLIKIKNTTIVGASSKSINLPGRYIFISREEFLHKYNMSEVFADASNNNPYIALSLSSGQYTEGAACTVLLAKEFINNDEPLLIVNSDQCLEWSSSHFVQCMNDTNADAGIVTFIASDNDTKWSFARINPATQEVLEVAEKKPISNIATAGAYWFKQGRIFVEAAEQMIKKNIRVNNEFYVCPVYNEVISLGYKVMNYPIPCIYGLGTPEEYELFKDSPFYKKL